MPASPPMTGLLARLSSRTPLLSDSATGTWFQQRLGVAHVGGECCDQYNVTAPDVVRELYRAKLDAGADLVLTNTFNSTPLRLAEFHMESEAADRFNAAGVTLLREVIAGVDREVFVGGNVGPTGKIIGQSATYDEVMASMLAQIRAQTEGTARALGVVGLLNVQFAIHGDDGLYVIEANPNPQLSEDEDFAQSAKKADIDYDSLLQRIVNLGLRWEPTRLG